MPRRRLTDAFLRSLKPAQAGKRDDWMDEVAPGLGVRVTDKGKASYVLIARFPGSGNPTRRVIGEFGTVPMRPSDKPVMELAQARDKAREWRWLLAQEIDPRQQEEERRARELEERDRARRDNFGAAVEDYLKRHVRGQRKAVQVEREIRANLVPAWGAKPHGLPSRP